jgi:hypothetical protein
MLNYAVLDNSGLVINVIVAESKEIAELVTEKSCIEYSYGQDVVVGITIYNGSSFVNPEE